MNWPYIAGFFDGEGCIQARYGSAICHITQKRIKVLQNIKEFLTKEGIPSGISTRKKLGVSSLYITKSTDTIKFLKQIFPYLIVKKTEAQDIIRLFTLFPVGPNRTRKFV